jgi:hypothetical protein
MKWHLLSVFLLAFLPFIQGLTSPENNKIIIKNRGITERYRYEAYPVGEGAETQKEAIKIELAADGTELRYISRVISSKLLETTMIRMDKEGKFISGVRKISSPSKKEVTEERIWKEDSKVYIKKITNENGKVKRVNLPDNKILAVDGSLLVVLRSFPFNKGNPWDIFMIDFSGHSVTVTVRETGTERVVVPAGEFDCYRMDVVVGIPILRPTITYWIAKEKPHFLVKTIGKRGPFTDTYVTSLVSNAVLPG